MFCDQQVGQIMHFDLQLTLELTHCWQEKHTVFSIKLQTGKLTYKWDAQTLGISIRTSYFNMCN